MLVSPTTLASPASAADPDPSIADAQSAATEDAAHQIAVQYGHDVRVDSETSPTQIVHALPSGGFSAESDIIPKRVRKNGEWVPEDTTLTAQSGWLAPVAAASPVRFSSGGSTTLAQVLASDGSWMTEYWPYGSLPTPVVDDSSARYPDVFPGVDLQVAATEVGMSEVLIIKTAAAADDSRLANVQFTVGAAKTAVRAKTDSLTATTPTSGVVSSATPLWWDSSAPGASADDTAGSEAHGLDFEAGTSSVSLDVSSVTSQADLKYPVYVDPAWSPNPSHLIADWYDDRAYPNQSYFDPPEDYVGYGIQGGVGYLSRAFFQFDTSVTRGKQINSSSLQMTQTYANSCDTTLVQAWRYDSTATGFSWNSEPAAWAQLLDQQGNANGGPCAPNPAAVGWDVTQGAVYAAANSLSSLTIGLRVANEGNSLTRKHYRWDASLNTMYNTPPATPTNLHLQYPSSNVRDCASSSKANPILISTRGDATVPMYGNVSDPDVKSQASLQAVLYLNDATGSTEQSVYSEWLTPTYDPNNLLASNPTKTAPDGTVKVLYGKGMSGFNTANGPKSLLDGHIYKWYLVPTDGLAVGPHSTPCYFQTFSANFDATTAVSIAPGTMGTKGTATISSLGTQSSRVAGWKYWTTNGPPSAPDTNTFVVNQDSCRNPLVKNADGTVVGYICSSTLSATINFPVSNDQMTFQILAVDKVGNYAADTSNNPEVGSATSTFTPQNLGYSSTGAGHGWITEGDPDAPTPIPPSPLNIPDSHQGSNVSLVIPDGAGATPETDPDKLSNGFFPGYALNLSGTVSSPIQTSMSVSNSSQSFAVGVWAKPTAVTGYQTLVSQAGSGNVPAFELRANGSDAQFCMTNLATNASACATASNVLAAKTWRHLTGVWDAANSQLRIYPDTGSMAATSFSDANDPGSTAVIALGSKVSASGQISTPWAGTVSDLVVLGGVPTPGQVSNITQYRDPQF